MRTDGNIQELSGTTAAFEREFESLIVEHFAAGAIIEGSHRVTAASNVVPDWTIEITHYPTVIRDDSARIDDAE